MTKYKSLTGGVDPILIFAFVSPGNSPPWNQILYEDNETSNLAEWDYGAVRLCEKGTLFCVYMARIIYIANKTRRMYIKGYHVMCVYKANATVKEN